ncbi:hypothetical protein [Numidum massiliense]|uniref:hypothetical protein n=1 Tax=Numidum massiliense TaxID=1522315 RepID=UPI0006D5528A|nr:hypothetical protein [Numidum massiliense]
MVHNDESRENKWQAGVNQPIPEGSGYHGIQGGYPWMYGAYPWMHGGYDGRPGGNPWMYGDDSWPGRYPWMYGHYDSRPGGYPWMYGHYDGRPGGYPWMYGGYPGMNSSYQSDYGGHKRFQAGIGSHPAGIGKHSGMPSGTHSGAASRFPMENGFYPGMPYGNYYDPYGRERRATTYGYAPTAPAPHGYVANPYGRPPYWQPYDPHESSSSPDSAWYKTKEESEQSGS